MTPWYMYWWHTVGYGLRMLVTEFRCWWHLLNVGARLFCKKIVDKNSQQQHLIVPTHLISNIRLWRIVTNTALTTGTCEPLSKWVHWWVYSLREVCSGNKNPDLRVIHYYDSVNGNISRNGRFREITFHGMSLKSQNTRKTQSLQRGSYRAVLWDLKLPQIYILCHLNKLDSSQFKYHFQIWHKN